MNVRFRVSMTRFSVSLCFTVLVALMPEPSPAFPISANVNATAAKTNQWHDVGYRTAKKRCFVDGAWREC